MSSEPVEFSSTHGEVSVEDLDERLPYVVEGATLMSPGTWNQLQFSEDSIQNALQSTDWEQESVRELFNEHDDDDSRDWIGRIRNPRMDGEDLVGDIELLDIEQAIKVAGGAEFGISPKVSGKRSKGNRMKDFVFDNFSLVLNPAVKTTFLNSEVQKVDEAENTFGDITMSEEQDAANAAEDTQETQDEQSESPELSEDDIQAVAQEVADIIKSETVENAEEDADDEAVEADAEDVEEDVAEEEAAEAEVDTEVDADADADSDVSEFEEFVSEKKSENPDMSFSEIAAEYEEAQKDASEKIDEVKQEFKQEIDSLKQELESVREQDDGIDAQKISQKFGEQKKSVREEVAEMSTNELDGAMHDIMLRAQGNGNLAGD